MHKRMVMDTAEILNTTEEGVFILALRKQRGMETPQIDDWAINSYHRYEETGKAPIYVSDFCLDVLRTRKLKATKICHADCKNCDNC